MLRFRGRRRRSIVLSSYQVCHIRNFIAARVKWVRDPWLDTVVSKEKNLKQVIALKNIIIFSPTKHLPLSSLSLLKPQLNLSTTVFNFIQAYPFLFTVFQPSPSFPVEVKLSRHAVSLHREEESIHIDATNRKEAVTRLAKFLMLTKTCRLPLKVIDSFSLDLGLPCNFVSSLLCDYPEYFNVSEGYDCLAKKDDIFLELVSWRRELAVSEVERRAGFGVLSGVKRGGRIGFALSYVSGFDLQKRVKDWIRNWQRLPYISPYENAFHLHPEGDQAEKWTVAVLHELLWLLVSKKTEKENIVALGEYLGFGDRFRKALIHHPGIFYVSNKNRTQTVVLREAFWKNMLIVKHPLIGMRFRYLGLMNREAKKRLQFFSKAVKRGLRKPESSSSLAKLKSSSSKRDLRRILNPSSIINGA